MKKKDYVLIAKSLNYSWLTLIQQEEGESASAIIYAAQNLATSLRNANPRFDRQKFMAAVKGEIR